MAHTVFICHSSKDKVIADAACAALEARRVPCWIAPRDVLGGTEYMEALDLALQDCRIVLLIFSQMANDSPQVRREIERAVSYAKIILPFRIEDTLPTRAMKFALSNTHWLDAITPPMERSLVELCDTVSKLIEKKEGVAVRAPLWQRAETADEESEQRRVRAKVERDAREAEQARLKDLAKREDEERKAQEQAQANALRVTEAARHEELLLKQRRQEVEGAPQQAEWIRQQDAPEPAPQSRMQTAVNLPRPPAQSILPEIAPRPVAVATKAFDFKASAAVFLGVIALMLVGLGIMWAYMSFQDRPASKLALEKKACDGGTMFYCDVLGERYRDGSQDYSIVQDPATAATFFQKACDGGFANGCAELGELYNDGSGVPKSPQRAAELYQEGCEKGSSQGCNDLGLLYWSGTGVSKDRQQALSLFQQACNGSSPSGCKNLASIYEKGLGVAENLVMAKQFYQKACDLSNQSACDALKNAKFQ